MSAPHYDLPDFAPSHFTAWLRANGHSNLVPEFDDNPTPLFSRIARLRKEGGTTAECKQLWEEWRAERRSGGVS